MIAGEIMETKETFDEREIEVRASKSITPCNIN
jgi:hypothetical protein